MPDPTRKAYSSDNKEDSVYPEISYFAPLHGQGNKVCDSKKQQCGNSHKECEEATGSITSLHIDEKEDSQQTDKHEFQKWQPQDRKVRQSWRLSGNGPEHTDSVDKVPPTWFSPNGLR